MIPKERCGLLSGSLNAKGEPCMGNVVPEGETYGAGGDFEVVGDGRHCYRHLLGDELWKQFTAKGGKTTAEKKRREGKQPWLPPELYERMIETCARLLDAVIPDTGEPDLVSRADGAMIAARLFRVNDRKDLQDRLTKCRPHLLDNPIDHERLLYREKVLYHETLRRRIVEAYEQGRIQRDDLPPGVAP